MQQRQVGKSIRALEIATADRTTWYVPVESEIRGLSLLDSEDVPIGMFLKRKLHL